MARTISIQVPDVELTPSELLDMVASETSLQYIIEHFGKNDVLSEISCSDAVDYYGDFEVLGYIEDEVIETEYFNRSPLGKAMAET